MTKPTYDQSFWEQLWAKTLREHPDLDSALRVSGADRVRTVSLNFQAARQHIFLPRPNFAVVSAGDGFEQREGLGVTVKRCGGRKATGCSSPRAPLAARSFLPPPPRR